MANWGPAAGTDDYTKHVARYDHAKQDTVNKCTEEADVKQQLVKTKSAETIGYMGAKSVEPKFL